MTKTMFHPERNDGMKFNYYDISYFDKDGNRLRTRTAKALDLYRLNEDDYINLANSNHKLPWHHCKIYRDGELITECNNKNIVS